MLEIKKLVVNHQFTDKNKRKRCVKQNEFREHKKIVKFDVKLCHQPLAFKIESDFCFKNVS